MAKSVLQPLNLNYNEIQNLRLQSLTSDPTPGTSTAVIYYNSNSNRIRFHNGTEWVDLTDSGSLTGIGSIGVTSPLTSTGGNNPTLGITESSASSAGSMSSAHFTLLTNATTANNANTLVRRGANGDFSAGTITATLDGSASLFDGKGPAHYLDRASHTGTQLASTISNLKSTVTTYRLDEFAIPTSDININNNRITGLSDPMSDTDAANKRYVDSTTAGLDYKESVLVAATSNITISGVQTIDGVSLAVGNRVLVAGQTNAAQNGIYVVASGEWARAADADTGTLTSGAWVYVEDGTANGGKKYVLSTKGTITVGTTNQEWVVYGAGEILEAGNGLNKSGSIFSAVGTADRITVGAGGIDIASTYAGQVSITTVGTIGTGTWQGTAIGAAYGGTGRTSLTSDSYLVGNGTGAVILRTPGEVLTNIGAAPLSHTHNASAINAGRLELERLPTSGTANRVLKVGTANSDPVWGQVAWGEVTGKPTEFNPAAHVHSAGDVTTGTFDIARIPTGTTASTVALGNHNHTVDSLGDVTITANSNGEILRWNGSAWINNTLAEAGIAGASHVHDIDDVTGLQSALEGKADTVHTHATGDIASGTFSVARGGTGRSTLTANTFLVGNGTAAVQMLDASDARAALGNVTRKFVGTISGAGRTITHNFGTKDVVVKVYEGDDEVITDVTTTSDNVVTIGLAQNPAVALRVVVVG